MAVSKTTCSEITKPKRPLTAYNLFYRYKRAKIIEARGENTGDSNKEAVCQLVATMTGLESYEANLRSMIPPDRLDDIRQKNIRLILEKQLFAKDTKNRPHRKSSHGFKMSFTEMNTIMVDSWKQSDKFTKSVFKELAEEGRRVYQKKLAEYNKQMHLSSAKKFSSLLNPEDQTPKVNKPQAMPKKAVPPKPKSPVAPVEMSTMASSQFCIPCVPLPLENHRNTSTSSAPYQFCRRPSPQAEPPASIEVRTRPFMFGSLEQAAEQFYQSERRCAAVGRSLDSSRAEPRQHSAGQFYQPKRHFQSQDSSHNVTPVYEKPLMPATITPSTSTTMGSFPVFNASEASSKSGSQMRSRSHESNGNESGSHMGSRGHANSFSFPSAMQMCQQVTKGSDDYENEDSSSSESDSQSAMGEHKRNVSVDDFMELINTLSQD